MSPHCLETRNYPRPNCLLKCLPNCLSSTREGFLSCFKSTPTVRVIARQLRDQKLSRSNFCPTTSRCLFWPTGKVNIRGCQRTTVRKTPAISTRKCLYQKLANPCPILGQLLASQILYKLLVGENIGRRKQYEIAQARFCTQSCSKVGQLLVNSLPTSEKSPRP